MSAYSPWPMFFWVILPYLALASFFLGHVWRYATDKFGWGSHSTQILERRILRWANPLFHYGTFAAIGGHAAGILVPYALYRWLGVPDELYHVAAISLGGLAGLAMVVGLAGLLWRRWTTRVREVSSGADWMVEVLFFLTALIGVAVAIGRNLAIGPYDYRVSVGPWFRTLFTFHADPALMTGVPLLLEIHVVMSFLVLAVWPYTRLVHVWSAPLGYLTRAYIPYRPRAAAQGSYFRRPQGRRPA